MHLLDIKNFKVHERKFHQNVRPFFKQEVCVIPILLPKLNKLCEKCRHSDVIFTKGKVNELGIGGWMSNQKDPLKPIKANPPAGITLREPRAIIQASGQVHCCRHPQQTVAANFYLTSKIPNCTLFQKKIEFEYEKMKKKGKK